MHTIHRPVVCWYIVTKFFICRYVLVFVFVEWIHFFFLHNRLARKKTGQTEKKAYVSSIISKIRKSAVPHVGKPRKMENRTVPNIITMKKKGNAHVCACWQACVDWYMACAEMLPSSQFFTIFSRSTRKNHTTCINCTFYKSPVALTILKQVLLLFRKITE